MVSYCYVVYPEVMRDNPACAIWKNITTVGSGSDYVHFYGERTSVLSQSGLLTHLFVVRLESIQGMQRGFQTMPYQVAIIYS